jgi:hypothetical protein
LFAEVRDFLLYDFYTDDGHVNEDVYAYSNQSGNERALVIYHNRYATTRGWIRQSASYAEKRDGSRHLRQRTLGEAFGLSNAPESFVVFRDATTGLEYLHRSGSVRDRGMHLELSPYRCHVFLDWREVRDDTTRPWSALCDRLRGRGVTSLEDELRALELEPVHSAVLALLERSFITELAESATGAVSTTAVTALSGKKIGRADAAKASSGTKTNAAASTARDRSDRDESSTVEGVIGEAKNRLRNVLHEAETYVRRREDAAPSIASGRDWTGDVDDAVDGFESRLRAALKLKEVEEHFSEPWPKEACAVLPSVNNEPGQTGTWAMLVAWAAIEALGNLHTPGAPNRPAEMLFERLRLRNPIATALQSYGVTGEDRWRGAALVRANFAHAAWSPKPDSSIAPAGLSWLHDAEVAWLIGVHEHEGVRYLVREPFERLMWWMALPSLLEIAGADSLDVEKIAALEHGLHARVRAAEEAAYQVEVLLDGATATK